MDATSRVWYNGSYTIAAKSITTLELHYTMIQFLIIYDGPQGTRCKQKRNAANMKETLRT